MYHKHNEDKYFLRRMFSTLLSVETRTKYLCSTFLCDQKLQIWIKA